MDPELLKRALAAVRGQPVSDSAQAAPQQAAPSAVQPGMAQAYGGMTPPSAQQATPPPFAFNQGLENKVAGQGGNNDVTPLLQAIMKHLGMLSVIRNQSNQVMDAGTQG